MEALGRCRWCCAIGVLAIGFVACSAYGAMSPITDESNQVGQSVDPSLTPLKQDLSSNVRDVSEVIFNTDGGLRDITECTPDISTQDHTCYGVGTPEGEWEQDDTCGLIEGGDNYNAGCNSTLVPPPFSPISCGETICGTWATAVQGTTVLRDTDWYEITFTQRTRMMISMTGEFDISLGLISSCGTGNCGLMPEYPFFWTAGGFYGAACNDEASSPGGYELHNYLDVCVEAGTWWIFASGDWGQAPVDCGNYLLTLECEAPCHVACCTGNDICQEISYSECIYSDAQCGPGHYGGAPQTVPDCVAGLCAWGCPGETLVCPSSNSIDNSVNSDIANPPMSCATGDSIGLLWFNFVATANSVEIQTCNTIESDDSVFALYGGDCENNLIELACSEDEDCGPGDWLGYISHCDPPLVVGETYYIQFAAWQASSQGVYRLDLACPSPECGPGACCLPNGSCTFLPRIDCEAEGVDGSFQGADTDCDMAGICDQGACCLADGSCIPATEILCDALGVQWISGVDCDPNPCSGACCTYAFGNYQCANSAPAACTAPSQTFYPGEQCDGAYLFECTDYRLCDLCKDTSSPYSGPWQCDAASCQYVDSDNWPAGVVGGVSDENPVAGGPPNPPIGFHRADDFIPHDAAITHICWWGFYRDVSTPIPDPPPTELIDHFFVTYYASDANLCPNLASAVTREEGQDMTVNRTPWGERVLPEGPYAAGHQIWLYEADHDSVAVIPEDCYWVEIANSTDDGSGQQTRLWYWSTAPFYQGNGFSLANDGPAGSGYFALGEDCQPSTYRDFDLAFCLNVANDPCVHCSDICATATKTEDEPTCYDGYLDTYNEGCSVADYWTPVPPHMVDVACADVVCGKTGTYECEARCDDNQDCPATEICLTTHFCSGYPYNCRDVDWYRVSLDATYNVELSLTGTAPMYTEFYNPYGIDECRPALGQVMLIPAPACHSDGDWALMGQGIYYLFTAPDNIFEGLVCDEQEYVFHVRCEPVGGECTASDCDSCREHGAAGRLCLNMGVSGGVEPRLGGIQELDITVDSASGFTGGVSVDCGPCTWSGTASGVANGNVVTVTLDTALPDECCCTVTLDCNAQVCVCGLEGDIDRGGLVSTGDASIIKPKFGQTPTAATAEFDYDVSGLISTGDFSQVKPKFGNTLVNPCP